MQATSIVAHETPVRAVDIGTSVDHLPTTVIEPSRGWSFLPWSEIWRNRELFWILAWRDVKVRYKQTVLGAAWAILQPLMMMMVFTIFLGGIANVSSGDVPYPVFVFAGLLPWTFFATTVGSAANSVVGSERLISKVYFPRLIVPFSCVGTALVDLAISFVVLLAMMVWYGITPGWSLLLLPIPVAMLILAALGIGTMLSALTVAYRDFRYVVPFVMQLWMFATPSVYMEIPRADTANSASVGQAGGTGSRLSRVPPIARAIMDLNPATATISAFRAAAVGRALPWGRLLIAAPIVVLAFFGGAYYFRRVERYFADII